MVEQLTTDRDTLAYYCRLVDRSLSRGDYIYAAEYTWMAYAHAIQVADSNCRIDGTASNDTTKMAQQVNRIVFSADAAAGDRLRTGFHAARSLYWHLGENDLNDSLVEEATADVMSAIDLLQTLFERRG